MVKENPKTFLWWALFLTITLFGSGVILGIFLESSREQTISQNYKETEAFWQDVRLQSYFYQMMNSDVCEQAISENLNFADRIYQEGLLLQRYETGNEITGTLLLDKKRYVLLKTEFWLNSILLNKKCSNMSIPTVVYFYSQYPESISKKAEQAAVSSLLFDLKQKYGNNVLLIPLAEDLNITVVDIIKDKYNLTEFPTVLINEKTTFTGVPKLEELEDAMGLKP
jgi:hypothetical protein